jgi:hypothetical protein
MGCGPAFAAATSQALQFKYALAVLASFLLTTMFVRASLFLLVATLAALLCVQPVEARGPKVTHKVYFDIKHGEKTVGRSASRAPLLSRVPVRALTCRDLAVW